MSQSGLISSSGSSSGSITSIITDSGTVTPVAGVVNALGGTNATTSGSGSTLTINSTSSGITWSAISASQTLIVNRGYFCSSGGALSLALPAVSTIGNVIEVILNGSSSFSITQGAGQQIRLGNSATTAGVGGSLSSTQQGDAIRLMCQTPNLLWVIASSEGNLTIV